jgi:hypothetical protein
MTYYTLFLPFHNITQVFAYSSLDASHWSLADAGEDITIFNYFKDTVIPHKIEVYKGGMELIEKGIVPEELKVEFVNNLIIHDLSKFSVQEAAGYAYYNRKTKEGREAFELAWHHHKMNNPHHPEHWLNPTKRGNLEILPMPKIYILEMVADWIGAGRSYGNELKDWLPNNLHNFLFHRETRRDLTTILSQLGFYIKDDRGWLFASNEPFKAI